MICSLLLFVPLAYPVLGQWVGSLRRWKTQPQILPQLIEIARITQDRSKLSPGYIFTAPQTFTDGWGPKIYGIDGQLIWDGKYAIDLIASNFHVCDYDGVEGQHLCWHEASLLGAYKKGSNESDIHDYNRVFDSSYTQVSQNLSLTGELDATTDAHEFYILNGGSTYLQTVLPRKHMDLTPWNGLDDGVVFDGCLQEMDMQSEEPIFSWCFLDHLPLESFIYIKTQGQQNLTTTVGGAGHWLDPWDFFHANSIDKNGENDYIISGRHLDQVIKIAGPHSRNAQPGTVLWRLGGHSSNFTLGQGVAFSRQHHARYVSTGSNETVISLFDNAWEGESANPSQQYSSAKIISINNTTREASLVQEYPHPYGRLCRSGGSAQILPNGNVFVGWGFIREVTEFHANGTVLYHGVLKNAEEPQVYNYRTYKFPWIGNPGWPPKLLAYAQDCSSRDATLVAYVSWNGATNVAAWRFYTSDFLQGPWRLAGTLEKIDFETRALLRPSYYAYVAAEALDSRGNVLARTNATTFVPNAELAAGCEREGCVRPEHFDYDAQYSRAHTCKRRYSTPVSVLLVLAIGFETYSLLFWRIFLGSTFEAARKRRARHDATDPAWKIKV